LERALRFVGLFGSDYSDYVNRNPRQQYVNQLITCWSLPTPFQRTEAQSRSRAKVASYQRVVGKQLKNKDCLKTRGYGS